jgi:hypothetical protein
MSIEHGECQGRGKETLEILQRVKGATAQRKWLSFAVTLRPFFCTVFFIMRLDVRSSIYVGYIGRKSGQATYIRKAHYRWNCQ